VSQEAPGELELVRAFVNSVDLEDDTDELETPGALVAWLAERGLVEAGGPAGPADLGRAIEVREALRQLLLAHHDDGGPPPPAAVEVVAAAARRSQLELRFGADGVARPEPVRDGVDGALGRLLAAVAAAQADGTWERLKACPWDTCQCAFYDHSKNKSRAWCSMAVCGNRAKVKAYRERQAARRA
jgi:predicted RNA-binding Zn ribbon-like protein